MAERVAAARPTTLFDAKRHASGGGSPFMPKRRRHRVSQRGRIPFSLGGSERGMRLAWGDFGIQILSSTLLTARQLDNVRVALRRITRNVKGVKIHMRVFPDIPMTSKGIEVRMGKGKGSIDYWVCRVRSGRVIFELVGDGLTEDMAEEAVRAAGFRLPVAVRLIKRNPADYVETGKIFGVNATKGGDADDLTGVLSVARFKRSSMPRTVRTARLPAFVKRYEVPIPESLASKGLKVEDLGPNPRLLAHIPQL